MRYLIRAQEKEMTSSLTVFPSDFRVLTVSTDKTIRKGPDFFLLSRQCRVNLELKGSKPITRTAGELKVI